MLPLHNHNQLIYSPPLPVKYDWYLILADKNHVRYLQQELASTPERYRVAIITDAKVTTKYRRIADSKNIYLIELDEDQFEVPKLEAILKSLYIPPGIGCLYIKASSQITQMAKKYVLDNSLSVECR